MIEPGPPKMLSGTQPVPAVGLAPGVATGGSSGFEFGTVGADPRLQLVALVV